MIKMRSAVWVRRSKLLALFNGIPSRDPVAAKVVGNIKHSDLGETHAVESFVSGTYGRAVIPGATAAIQNNELLAGQLLHALSELFQCLCLRSRANVFRARDM